MAPALLGHNSLRNPSLFPPFIGKNVRFFYQIVPFITCNPSPFAGKQVSSVVVRSSALKNNAQTRERQRLKEQFKIARERCRTDPMDGVTFSVEEFLDALDDHDLVSEVGTKVYGTVFGTDSTGADVNVSSSCSAFLPLEEACMYKINHVADAGILPGFEENFVIIGKNLDDNRLILSRRPIQYSLAWERCRQLQSENAVLICKIIGGKRGGLLALVEGLQGFIPLSQVSKRSGLETLIGKELPLKILEIDEKSSKLILSNRKANSEYQEQDLTPGSVVTGTVDSLKPYGAIVNVAGLTALLHISQISHAHVSDISAILKPGDIIKGMVLRYDHEKDRLSLSTKKLEPMPGDMIHRQKLVYDQAEEMARLFLQKIVEAEEAARAFSESESEV
ncbi:small ribosomal subunit protein bS1c-like [Wolffia australiana]